MTKQNQKNDFHPVHRPSHYNRKGIECITAIEASMSEEEFLGYLKGNVLKYVWRYAYKNGLEDLDKMLWYGTKLRTKYEEGQNTKTKVGTKQKRNTSKRKASKRTEHLKRRSNKLR